MDKIITKKRVFLAALVGTVVSAFFTSEHFYDYCFSGGHCWQLYNFVDTISYPLIFFPAILLFSLVTYKMNDKVFVLWGKFTFFWILLSIFSIAITPNSSAILQVVDKELITALYAGLFVIISATIIAFKFYRLRKK